MHSSQRKREARGRCRRAGEERAAGVTTKLARAVRLVGVSRVGHCRRLPQQHGGMPRSRTYSPLIKSGRWPMIRTAQCCEGFPVNRLKL
jgi:hypothetical protein